MTTESKAIKLTEAIKKLDGAVAYDRSNPTTDDFKRLEEENAKLKQQLDVLKGAAKEISMYGISEPNTQAKIAIEALKEIET